MMESVCDAGFCWPWNAEKDRLFGLTAKVGGATTNVTGTVKGELVAAAALKEIVAV